MKHEDVWRAIDTMAAEHGLSVSALARRAGLAATSFNPSKRIMPDGRPRWPSTESLAKVLLAIGNSLDDFAALMGGANALPARAGRAPASGALRRIPLIGLAQAGGDGFSTMAVSRSAARGMRSACPRSATLTPMRWRSAANRWSRYSVTAMW